MRSYSITTVSKVFWSRSFLFQVVTIYSCTIPEHRSAPQPYGELRRHHVRLHPALPPQGRHEHGSKVRLRLRFLQGTKCIIIIRLKYKERERERATCQPIDFCGSVIFPSSGLRKQWFLLLLYTYFITFLPSLFRGKSWPIIPLSAVYTHGQRTKNISSQRKLIY